MKNYLIFGLILGAEIAQANVQTSTTQDKPARIYVKSYHVSIIGTTKDPGPPNPRDVYAGSVDYTDDSLGTESYHEQESNDLGYAVDNIMTLQNSWMTIMVSGTLPSQDCYTNTYGPGVRATAFSEHCDINVFTNNSLQIGIESRYADTITKLQTGGRPSSKLRNLFAISAGATELAHWPPPLGSYYAIYPNFPPVGGIPPQNISVGSYGSLDSSGYIYKSLPDNTEVDVTPTASGCDFYTFGINATKYHCYFEVFVEPSSLRPLETGHAFWRFSTEAPNDALRMISSNLTSYLGQAWGFYPSNDTVSALFGAPGKLQNDNSTIDNAYMVRKFHIGFPNLKDGLNFTRNTQLNRPAWTLLVYDCVDAAFDAGSNAGLRWPHLPLCSPTDFAWYLSIAYPGPWLNNSTIFYP